jgi:hypothetical protein
LLTAKERAEMRALDDDLVVTLWPASHWTSDGDRLWTCHISRAEIMVAGTTHETPTGAFLRARAMLERRTA